MKVLDAIVNIEKIRKGDSTRDMQQHIQDKEKSAKPADTRQQILRLFKLVQIVTLHIVTLMLTSMTNTPGIQI